jgi:hypothetical protein
MPAMEHCAAAADLEVAHLALDASRIEAAAATDAAAAANLVE